MELLLPGAKVRGKERKFCHALISFYSPGGSSWHYSCSRFNSSITAAHCRWLGVLKPRQLYGRPHTRRHCTPTLFVHITSSLLRETWIFRLGKLMKVINVIARKIVSFAEDAVKSQLD